VERAEQMGIIFIDEIDKVAGRESGTVQTFHAKACNATFCPSSKALPSTPVTG